MLLIWYYKYILHYSAFLPRWHLGMESGGNRKTERLDDLRESGGNRKTARLDDLSEWNALPEGLKAAVEDAITEDKVDELLERFFDPTTFPQGFNFEALVTIIRSKIANAPDNVVPELPHLASRDSAELKFGNKFATGAAAVEYLNSLMSLPPEVHPPALSPPPLVHGSVDPWLNQESQLAPTHAAIATVPLLMSLPGAVCLGSWNSEQYGHCHVWTVPDSNSFATVPGAVIVGWMNGRPVWANPN